MLVRTRVKICGIKRSGDAQLAAQLGADALGFVFWEGSSRAVAPALAAGIMAGLPAFVSKVGLFVDAGAEQVRQVCSEAPLDMLQFHGEEAPDYCGSFGRPYIKAIRGISRESIEAEAARYPDAAAIIVDSVDGGRFGGTGKSFDWRMLPPMPQRLVLAGGLEPGNVAEAIRRTRPYGVDVSGGVEDRAGGNGFKDHQRLLAFFGAVRDGDEGRLEA